MLTCRRGFEQPVVDMSQFLMLHDHVAGGCAAQPVHACCACCPFVSCEAVSLTCRCLQGRMCH
jgi:hypothetical protein